MSPHHDTPRTVDVIVVGAGQAGLSISAHLSQMNIDHVLFERGEVAQRWQHERWDSLTTLTPNWMCQLPGTQYSGNDPDGYMTKFQLASFIREYAHRIAAPVIDGTEVTNVKKIPGGYQILASGEVWYCCALVDATGSFALGKRPPASEAIPISVEQVNASDYRCPHELSAGGVLVVGASATGLQLADEIQASGRQVVLAVGEHVRMPRTYAGKDIYQWLDQSGVIHETADQVDDLQRARRVPSPQLIGRSNHTMDLNTLMSSGVELVGRLVGQRGTKSQFSGALQNHCRSADLKLGRLLDRIDAHAMEVGINQMTQRLGPTNPPRPRLEVDLTSGEIATVVWATGFRADLSWLTLPVFDKKGRIRHQSGVLTDFAGIFTIGQPLMRSRKSSFIFGMDDDARFIAETICVHLNEVYTPRFTVSS